MPRLIHVGQQGFNPLWLVHWRDVEEVLTLIFRENVLVVFTGEERRRVLAWLTAQSSPLKDTTEG